LPIGPVGVTVQDAAGNTVSNATTSITVALVANPADATLSGTVTLAAVNGIAIFLNLRIDQPGAAYSLTASAAGITGATSALFDVSATPPPIAAQLAFIQSQMSAAPGTAISPVIVAVQDAAGNPVASASDSITVALGANPAGGTLSGTVTLAAVNGIAVFSNLTIDRLGAGYTLTASAAGLTGATSAPFNVSAMPGQVATMLAFTLGPRSAAAGTAINPIAVTVQDAAGNIVGSATTSITVALGANNPAGTATLFGTSTIAAVDGIAIFTNLSIDESGAGYRLTANAAGLTGATSKPFEVTSVFSSVSAGWWHTCSVTTSGATYCWGSNYYGQLGSGPGDSTSTPESDVWSPVALEWGAGYPRPPPLGFVQVSANGGHTCGITVAGVNAGTYCWGYGPDGDGSSGPFTHPMGPAALNCTEPIAFAAVSAGGDSIDPGIEETSHTCAVTPSGAAYCYGGGSDGELGDGSTLDAWCLVPVAGGLSFASVTAGGGSPESGGTPGTSGGYTCGVTTAGAAYCWGANSSGQLGDGTTTGRTSPAAVVGGLVFASVSAGGDHTCGLTTAGAAYCWGANSSGQIGDGTTTTRTSPAAVLGKLSFISVSAGLAHSCGVTTAGAVYCWGDNSSGQLGDGSTASRTTPVAVLGGLTLAAVSAGGSHTCGIEPVGTVYCWGANVHGQLGDGTNTNSSFPVKVLAQP
jgi:alpha-tubulin suppressor-like RCC1 family protein